MSGEYFNDDDLAPASPGLQPVKVSSKPEQTPPPFLFLQAQPSSPENVSDSTSKHRKRSKRVKLPSQGDAVLLRFMAPNNPDVADEAGKTSLLSDSSSEDDSENETSSRSEESKNNPVEPRNNADRLKNIAQETLYVTNHHQPQVQTDPGGGLPTPAESSRDNARSPDSTTAQTRLPGVGEISKAPYTNGLSPTETLVASPTETLASTSPDVAKHQILQSDGLTERTLPAISDQPNGSANIELPPVRDLLRATGKSPEETRVNGYPNRQSFPSNGPSIHSPILNQHFPGTGRSPSGQFPLGQTSPLSTHSEISPQEPYLKAGSPPGSTPNLTNQFFPMDRRRSQASDNAPVSFPTPLSSAPSEGFKGSDRFSPRNQNSPSDRMSIDGSRPQLSPVQQAPQPQLQPQAVGGYKCEYPGCTAPPFQTQYLLNSHANVHSQNRPHYCSIRGCPRGEGGKGFKRKNEMIRHGLVHDSPGYVCPFCPERDHKYPRPDNLQRHVRVHHIDKSKDDPQLREVLAQRPEGGTRGRRRRVGG